MKCTPIDAPGWEEVLALDDAASGLRAILAIHAAPWGRSFGGIRVRPYPDQASAVADATALACAMSRKTAWARIEGGGAKTVVMVDPAMRRPEAIAALGAFIESLDGRYGAGGDLGFTLEDDAVLRGATRFVACSSAGDAAAAGVVASIQGWVDARGLGSLDALHVLVQGAGEVGGHVVARLRSAGARVTVADVDPARTEIDPDALWDVEADVFCPCAVGGVLDADTIPRLRAAAVIGGANNPLADEDADAERLAARGIDYVPDFVANVGATIRGALGMLGRGGEADGRLAEIRPAVGALLARAREERRSPLAVARTIVGERMAAWPPRARPPGSAGEPDDRYGEDG